MKVLIISHNPISSQSSMGKTFMSLFSQFDNSELCQLYIYPTVPSERFCGAYYRVTDKEAVKGAVFHSRIGGEIDVSQITGEQGAYENATDESLYRNKKNKSALRRLLRDVAWSLAPWYNRSLEDWLDREAPTCIFVAPGVAKFLYDFAIRISKDRGIPIVTYICDEFYFVQEPDAVLDKLRLTLLKSKIEELLANTGRLIVISEELKREYAGRFGVETDVLMTGSAFTASEYVDIDHRPKTVCYFGNVRSNRYFSLGQIGSVLDELNQDLGSEFRLKIYTSEKDREILNYLGQYQSIELCGFVTGTAFEQKLRMSDVLLHVEAFDADSIDRVRHSVSTKIADSLASGVPLLAYGPEEVSSMKHLIRHECAITVASREQLRGALLTVLTEEHVRRRTVENALRVAREYHDSECNSRLLKDILCEMSKEK